MRTLRISDGIIFQTVGDEVIAYSPTTGQAHCLTHLEHQVLESYRGPKAEPSSDERSAVGRVVARLLRLRLLEPKRLPPLKPGLMVSEVGDELLVYDSGGTRAFSLNPAAAAVFNLCRQGANEDEALAALGLSFGEVNQALLEAGLYQLGQRELLSAPVAKPESSRRLALKAAALWPLLASVAAPVPATAASCSIGEFLCGGACCPPGSACCSNVCCGTPGSTCCGGACCFPGFTCCGTTCCTPGFPCCGTTCCTGVAGACCGSGCPCIPGFSCVGGDCLPT
ncbi:MAG: hypothetical protein KC910_19045 [Candidatus Eremiobacteraeota bacterium]|nr:hypothetical protein [Candidatus Eremiobacteraeota bacterium]